MAKKFYDIIPPQKIPPYIKTPEERKEELSPKLVVSPKKTSLILERKDYPSRPKRTILKTFFICFLLLILLGTSALFVFSKAEIEIWPATKTLTLTKTVNLDLNQENPDPAFWLEKEIIPGEVLKKQKSDSVEFLSSGKTLKEERAKGVIRVYNAYSTSSQGLLAGTRFVSTDGKLFRSIKREVISGGRYEKGKLVPGQTDIEVQAAEAGEEYNIGPSTFSIPGFAGTPKYTAFYGKSFSPMTGGFKDEVSQVSQEDLDKARDVLRERLRKEGIDSFKKTISEDFVLLDETISQEIIEESYSEEAGNQAESFELYMIAETKGLVFKKSDMGNFAKSLINLNIEEDKTFQEKSLIIEHSPRITEEEDRGKIVILDLEIKARVYSDIDLNELKRALLGRSVREIKIFLEDQPEIIKTEINLGPFWRRKIPEDINKVEIKLRI